MKPRAFDGMTANLQPAKGDEDTVLPLPVYQNGHQHVSCWELEPGDLEKIQETGHVWLSVNAKQHPVVCVSADPLLVVGR